MKKAKSSWIPEISYEQDENDAQLGNLPLIHVPPGEKMPQFLMIWEARDTGEIEPGLDGEEVPVVEWDLRQYASMDTLKVKLSAIEYDVVREALGLEPLKKAITQGKALSQRVRETVATRESNVLEKKS